MAEPDTVVEAHEKYALPLTFASDGDELVSGGFDGTVSTWNVADWSKASTARAHEQSVNCGAITNDELVVTGSTDTTLGVWTGDLNERVHTFSGHEKTVAGAASHPSRPLVASASYDATVRVWEVTDDPDPIVLEGHPRNVTNVVFADDGRTLASGGIGDEIIVWSLDAEEEVTRLGGHGQAVSGISTQRDDQMWSVDYEGTVHRWSCDDWTAIDEFDLPNDRTPNGIAVNGKTGDVAVSQDGGVLVFDAEGTLLAEHEASIKGIYRPRWSPAEDLLCVGGADGKIRVYR